MALLHDESDPLNGRFPMRSVPLSTSIRDRDADRRILDDPSLPVLGHDHELLQKRLDLHAAALADRLDHRGRLVHDHCRRHLLLHGRRDRPRAKQQPLPLQRVATRASSGASSPGHSVRSGHSAPASAQATASARPT
ncbi:hypothetical protein DEH18_34565 [Streptomyces sp. NHF165]|uniref:hypothetical protein n=1 Tax=Streptomyces sp. NHF165 TaxID=2175864 RepID=UPI00132F0087|nr:hypothetical protein [Streptomyces sp. NHF165]QHF98107.1 hypothetical protein DEH18_34565 [Streptomyces sp. NHF165]